MIIFNFKNYPESTGENGIRLLDSLVSLQRKNSLAVDKIQVAVSMIDLHWAKKQYPTLTIIAQHVDSVTTGSTTGWVPADTVKSLGIDFTLINHSEHRVYDENIVTRLKALTDKGFKLIVCCENVQEAKQVLEASPYAIAFEPKDLIGSGVSVTNRPEAVAEFISVVKGKSLALIGAGVSTMEDVKKGLELGADGALLASAFVKAEDPEAKALELVSPLL
jgi:triosephosphate isomerase